MLAVGATLTLAGDAVKRRLNGIIFAMIGEFRRLFERIKQMANVLLRTAGYAYEVILRTQLQPDASSRAEIRRKWPGCLTGNGVVSS